jgi:hypothetical protein
VRAGSFVSASVMDGAAADGIAEDEPFCLMISYVCTREKIVKRNISVHSSPFSAIALGVVFATAFPRDVAADFIFPPVPVPSFIGMFQGDIGTFDPVTGAFSYSGSITAVQFPGEVVSTTDPLVTNGGVLSQTATFTGRFSMDPSGNYLDTTTTITAGSQVVYSSFAPSLTFQTEYNFNSGGIHYVYEEWSGLATTNILNPGVISSPFLDQFFSQQVVSGEGIQVLFCTTAMDLATGKVLAATYSAGTVMVPELDPGSAGSAMTLLIGSVLILTGRQHRR